MYHYTIDDEGVRTGGALTWQEIREAHLLVFGRYPLRATCPMWPEIECRSINRAIRVPKKLP